MIADAWNIPSEDFDAKKTKFGEKHRFTWEISCSIIQLLIGYYKGTYVSTNKINEI